MRLTRALPAAFAVTNFVIPFFPPFITLTAVAVPGVSLVPRWFAVALLAVMACIALYGIAVLLAPPRETPPTFWPLIVWIGSALLAAALGFDPREGLLFIAIFGLALVWHLGILRYYGAPGIARAIFISYLISGALASLAAIAMVATRLPASQFAIGRGRAIGTFILPGELAGYLIIFLPIAFAIARGSIDKRMRILAWIALAAGSVAFLMTYSRAGWMGMAAAVAFYLFFEGRVRRRYAPLILLGGLAAVLVAFNAHHDPSENYTRLSIWQSGIEIVRRFPLTGVGPFDFARIYPLVRLPDGDAAAFHAHSFLLTIFAETGLIGLLAVIFAWWRFAVELVRRLRNASPAHAAIALAVTAGLVGTWVQGLIDTVSVVIFGLWLPSMALALVTATDGLGEQPQTS